MAQGLAARAAEVAFRASAVAARPPGGRPDPRAQVAPMDLKQLVGGDAAQPEEERHRRLPQVIGKVLSGGQVDLL